MQIQFTTIADADVESFRECLDVVAHANESTWHSGSTINPNVRGFVAGNIEAGRRSSHATALG
jgi:hypothetical protein